MIHRNIFKQIENDLANFPVVGLLGPRQVGKTTLAKQIREKYTQSVYLDLELDSDLFKLTNAENYLKQQANSLVIIDEIQRKPDLFPLIRALCDQTISQNGRFLVLGSSSPDLIKQSSESLAGRISYNELKPFSALELNQEKSPNMILKLWTRGGFPDSFLAKEESLSHRWRTAFIDTFLERDIPNLGISIPAVKLKQFWTMLSHNQGQLLQASMLAKSLGISSPSIARYLGLLEDLFMVRKLIPWYKNPKKRLVKTPKVYIRDSGLLHSLLSITTTDQLYSHPIAGYSWEGFVIEQILSLVWPNDEVFFYRTSAGAELDLIIPDPSPDANGYIGIEIKYSENPKLTKGFYHSVDDLQLNKTYVVYLGTEEIPISSSVIAIPLVNLLQKLQQYAL
jgi:predicted AAA+ superfamily ATPase